MKMIKRYALKSTQIFIFSPHFLNVDNMIIIEHRQLKFAMPVLDMIMEGDVSQSSYFRLSFYFM